MIFGLTGYRGGAANTLGMRIHKFHIIAYIIASLLVLGLLVGLFGLRSTGPEASQTASGPASLQAPVDHVPPVPVAGGDGHVPTGSASASSSQAGVGGTASSTSTPSLNGIWVPQVEDVSARVTHSGGPVELAPNSGGNFPRIQVRERERIGVEVRYPHVQPGESIVVQMEDAGALGNGKPLQVVPLSREGVGRFEVRVTHQHGTHRVTLNRAGGLSRLEFWVGEDYGPRTTGLLPQSQPPTP